MRSTSLLTARADPGEHAEPRCQQRIPTPITSGGDEPCPPKPNGDTEVDHMSSITVITLAVLAALGSGSVALIHQSRPASIAGFSWRRSIDVHNEHWVERSSYWGPPEHARNHRTKKVNVSRPVQRVEWRTEYAFGRSQTRPVYRTEWRNETHTLHTYEVPKSRYSHTVEASGRSRADVAWPVTAGPVGVRRERYRVEFVGADGRRHVTRMGEARWRGLDESKAYLLRVTWYGAVLQVREQR
jgi:hypothetical protein